MKKRLHNFNLEQYQIKKHSVSENSYPKSPLFTKYFLKYQKEFFLTHQNGAIRTKIKRAKIIKSFQTSFMFQDRSDWRILLANKMKSVKALKNPPESFQSAEQIKLFSRIKSIHFSIFLPSNPIQPEQKLKLFYFYKACKNIGLTRKLEHLELNPVSKESLNYLKRLNSNKRVLGSLKALKIYVDWKGASESQISELLENKNLLKNVTSLKLSTLHTNNHFESFVRLGGLCLKLSSLTFGVQAVKNVSFSRKPRDVKTNYLQTLKAFQHLKTLQLCIADVLTFLKDFVLPSSIQSLKLSFSECLSKEIMLKIDKDFSEEILVKVFEENNLFVKFYENFKELNYLETLELVFSLETNKEAFQYQSYLFNSLLKRISSPLKNLKILPNPMFGRFDQIAGRTDPFLPQFFNSCENFAKTLETVKIGSSQVCCSKFDLSASWNKFPNLSSINIKVSFARPQESDVKMIGSFLQNFISLGGSITLIKLEAAIKRDAKSLLSVLKQMNQLKKVDQLKISLELGFVNSREVEKSGMSFADGINELKSGEKCYAKVKGISLNTHYGYYSEEESPTFLKEFQQKFDETFKLYD